MRSAQDVHGHPTASHGSAPVSDAPARRRSGEGSNPPVRRRRRSGRGGRLKHTSPRIAPSSATTGSRSVRVRVESSIDGRPRSRSGATGPSPARRQSRGASRRRSASVRQRVARDRAEERVAARDEQQPHARVLERRARLRHRRLRARRCAAPRSITSADRADRPRPAGCCACPWAEAYRRSRTRCTAVRAVARGVERRRARRAACAPRSRRSLRAFAFAGCAASACANPRRRAGTSPRRGRRARESPLRRPVPASVMHAGAAGLPGRAGHGQLDPAAGEGRLAQPERGLRRVGGRRRDDRQVDPLARRERVDRRRPRACRRPRRSRRCRRRRRARGGDRGPGRPGNVSAPPRTGDEVVAPPAVEEIRGRPCR